MTTDFRWIENEETASTFRTSGAEPSTWPLKWVQVESKIL